LCMGRGGQQNQDGGSGKKLFHGQTSFNHFSIPCNAGYSDPAIGNNQSVELKPPEIFQFMY